MRLYVSLSSNFKTFFMYESTKLLNLNLEILCCNSTLMLCNLYKCEGTISFSMQNL